MSFTLIGTKSGDAFHFTHWDWSEVLGLAFSHEWRPAGTVLETVPDWGGGYKTNDYQVVTAPDSTGLAEAISRYFRNPLEVASVKAV